MIRALMMVAVLAAIALPSSAADSVFVERAWQGTWGVSFPPFVPNVLGPVRFRQISDAAGPGQMDALRGPGTAAGNCPAPGERVEYYEGEYNFQQPDNFVACTNGENLFLAYRATNGNQRGVMHITTAIAGANPMWAGTFQSDGEPIGNVEGVYQGGGIATPLARLGDGGVGPDFTGCQFSPRYLSLYPHHPQLYSAVADRYLKLEIPSAKVLVWEEGVPVVAAAVRVKASSTAFAGPDDMPSSSEESGSTNEDGVAEFPVNPPPPTPTDTIALAATVEIGRETYECEGSIETGIIPMAVPYLGFVDEAIIEIERVEMEIDLMVPGGQNQGREPMVAEQSPRRPPENPLTRLPLIFEENRGQGAPTARYLAKTLRGELEVGPSHISIPSKGVGPGPAMGLEFVGGNADALGSVVERLPGRSNYLIGADPQHWIRGAEHVAKIRFASVYPGIDVVYYGNQQRLEYDFEVAPEADPDQIRMRVDGQAKPLVTKLGDLVVDDGERTIRLRKPVVFQEDKKGRTLIAANYRIDDRGDVGFEVGDYDRSRPLIIDPILESSTFLGGRAEDAISDVALDPQGNIYVTGVTRSSGIATQQAFQTSLQTGGFGQSDGFVAKLDPSGSRLLFLTYIGGRKDETPHGIAVDSQGSILLTGITTSEDFPAVAAYQDQLASQYSFGGLDAFALKLDSAGSALVYSTYLGGGALEAGGKIDVDAQGNAYVVGGTTSTDFPTTNAFQPVRGNAAGIAPDAFIAKLNPTGAPIYVTYLGGADSEWGFAVASDSTGAAWVVGMTDSEDFPVAAALQTEIAGDFDVFAAKLSASGQVLLTSGFLGGSKVDTPSEAAVDSENDLYITGLTNSNDFPLAGAAQSEFGGGEAFSQDAFVTKISSSGTQLLYSTYLGGSGTEVGNSIAVGPDGSAYVAGETDSSDMPLAAASQPFSAGGIEGFVVKLSPSGGRLDYSTYLGGSLDDAVAALAVDSAGRVVTAGNTHSPDFSVTPGSAQPDPAGGPEGFVARLAPGTPPPGVLSLSAASFVRIYGLAPDSFATAFGTNLAAQLLVDGNMPTTLGGTEVSIVDADGATHAARLYIVSRTQINYLIPPGVAPGLATLTVRVNGRVRATEIVRISPVAPGLFSAASNGAGVAAAVFLLADPAGGRSTGIVFDGNLAPVPLSLGAEGSELYVFLFGTGMRNVSGEVTVTIDGVPVPFAGPVAQGQFDGLDQLNLGPLPRSLAGRGEVEVVVTIDGRQANSVTLLLD